MSGDDDATYFERRLAQELSMADDAVHLRARRVHLEMACQYLRKLKRWPARHAARQARVEALSA